MTENNDHILLISTTSSHLTMHPTRYNQNEQQTIAMNNIVLLQSKTSGPEMLANFINYSLMAPASERVSWLKNKPVRNSHIISQSCNDNVD